MEDLSVIFTRFPLLADWILKTSVTLRTLHFIPFWFTGRIASCLLIVVTN